MIVPLPVFPAPDWESAFGADLRASNADRDVAADILCAAVADGRLTLAELDQRLARVLSARTLREIARLISDLPCARPRESRQKPQSHESREHLPAPRPVRPPARQEDRWSLLRSLLASPGSPGVLREMPAG